MNLAERFRPKEWAEVAGQDKAVGLIRGEYAQGRRIRRTVTSTVVSKS